MVLIACINSGGAGLIYYASKMGVSKGRVEGSGQSRARVIAHARMRVRFPFPPPRGSEATQRCLGQLLACIDEMIFDNINLFLLLKRGSRRVS